jgi:hypothetical protein
VRRFATAAAVILIAGALCAFQKPFREYYTVEGPFEYPKPFDYQQPAEFTFARMMYPQGAWGKFAGYARFDYREGPSAWTNDYPKSDRHFIQALRRLTRIDVRPVEQAVDPFDEDELFNWPFLYSASPNEWDFTDAQYGKLREYLARGGFILGDDFWGPTDWDAFQRGVERLFPGRPMVEIPDSDPIFHSVFNLEQRYQVPGAWAIIGAMPEGGADPHWRAIYDDQHRVMLTVLFNHDTGDSWEWADDARYPEKYSDLGFRTGINYIVYALSH